jgi:hypothetical protein
MESLGRLVFLQERSMQSLMAHSYNPITQEAEARNPEFWGQPRLCGKTLSEKHARIQKLMPVILATQEAEINSNHFKASPRQMVCKTLLRKKKNLKKRLAGKLKW